MLYREDFAGRDARPNRHVLVYKRDLLVICYKYTEPSEEAMERFNERFDEMDEGERVYGEDRILPFRQVLTPKCRY